MTLGLLMAGGRGERMRASGVERPKPLVPILGATLLERNLFALLRAGFRELVVSTPPRGSEVARFVATRLVPLAAAVGARLDVLEESRPLGNIGCAGLLRDRADDVLVVYADNLTALDLRAVARRHAEGGAALTLVAHTEPFSLPYGELTIVDGDVVSYAEKPVRRVNVCSGIAVLGRRALDVMPRDRATGLVDLTDALLGRGDRVAAFEHAEPWIDVNERSQIERAESLVAAQPEAFERWLENPEHVVDCILSADPEGIAVEGCAGGLCLPRRPAPGAPWRELDDLDACTGAAVRARLHRAQLPREEGVARLSAAAIAERDDVTPLLRRAAALTNR